MNSFTFGFRIVGPCSGERRLTDAAAAFAAYAGCEERADVSREAYLSAFQFGQEFADHLIETGSTKAYRGPCWSPWLWWDIDRDGDLPGALDDARRLCMYLVQEVGVPDDELLVFFSGSKGFHVGLQTAFCKPDPCEDFNRIARCFCENVAESTGVAVDAGIYDKVRAFRAPNSRHPKSGKYKRRLLVDGLLHLKCDAIVDLAAEPEAFDVPVVHDFDYGLARAWSDASKQVREQVEAAKRRRAIGEPPRCLNCQTLNFIREGAAVGDRHRLLYSAAANLAEFGCPPALAHALLTESALDSGLPPSDARRQIECGLAGVAEKGAAP